MKNLKIAFIVSSFPTTSETFIVNQIIDLIDRGHEVRIFAFQRNENPILHQKIIEYDLLEKTIFFKEFHVPKYKRYFPFFKFIISDFKNIDFLKLINSFNLSQLSFKSLNLRFFYKYWWFLNSGTFDIVHSHFGPNGAYIAQMKSMGFKRRSKLVTTFHGYDLNPSNLKHYKSSYKVLFQEVDLMTVNTKYTESLLRKITSGDKIEILPVGLDTGVFRKKNSSCNTEFKILFVGRLVEIKAPQLALEIYNLLIQRGHKNIELTIIGEGELKDELKRITKKNKLENVRLLGALSQEAILKEMDSAEVFLLPGIYDSTGRAETQGLVIQEAQAMKLPVIVSDVGGMKYGLIDGKTGYVVSSKDIIAFADKIEFLINNKEKRLAMGKAGRAFVKLSYDSKILGKRLEKLYNKVLQ